MSRPVYLADLSPWAKAAVGDAALEPLPNGYRIVGTAGSGAVLFHLYRPGWQHAVDARVPVRDAESAYRGLVDMAWVDARERSVVVTVDAEDFITSFDGPAA